MSAGQVIMPDDYRSLLAESGPGTLAGVLRLLAPGGPEGFNMGAEQESVLAGQESLFTWGVAPGLWEETDDDEDEHAGEVRGRSLCTPSRPRPAGPVQGHCRPSLTDGVTNHRGSLVWNGIKFPPPLRTKKAHEYYATHGVYTRATEFPDPGFPSAGELLLCGTTESRHVLAWDTRDPDPARWPVIDLRWAGPVVFPATVTELLIADLCGTGLGLTFSRPGNPARWAYPFRGPDAPWEN